MVVLGVLNLTGLTQQATGGSASRASHIHRQLLRPLIVGSVHGLAGSAAVALLVLATIRNPWWALAYLLVFGVGTIAGMMLMTIAIGVPLVLAGERHAQFGGKAADSRPSRVCQRDAPKGGLETLAVSFRYYLAPRD